MIYVFFFSEDGEISFATYATKEAFDDERKAGWWGEDPKRVLAHDLEADGTEYAVGIFVVEGEELV